MSDAVHAPQDLLQHAAFMQRLARSLLRYGPDPLAAEDVIQDTWRASLEHPPGRATDSRRWLARVVRNFALRRWRSELRRVGRERQAARDEALPAAETSLERAETLQRVVDAVRALEEPYRATILARFYEDLAPCAIAEREGVSVETVNTRLKRGLARLRERFERDRRDWRPALGLLAGESPCLPPLAGETLVLTLMQIKTLALAAAALAVAWGLWHVLEPGQPRSAPAIASRGEPSEADPTAQASEAAEVGLRTELPTSPVEPVLTGRVLDEEGRPVPEARVFVQGGEPRGINFYEQRWFTCDADGRWRALRPIGNARSRRWRRPPRSSPCRPASDVDFVVRRMPTGTVEVRVVEGAGRVPLRGFRISMAQSTERTAQGAPIYRFFQSQRASGDLVRSEVRVEGEAGRELRVTLIDPEVGNLWSKLFGEPELLAQEIHLVAGATEQVLFVLPERGVLRGQVVDPDGAPVANALVYFGAQARARGDEPFRPFRDERITDGARTAADGWFELRGDGQEVTAGHADFSAVTVSARQASRIVLGARGALRGRLLDADGRALSDVVLRLDERSRGPETTTDAGGGFAFERLEAGAHGLWRDRELLAAVRIAPGEEAELELRLAEVGRLELALRSAAPLELGALRGLLIGLERVSGLYELERCPEPATLVVPRSVLPGRYWLATSSGLVAPFTADSGVEHVEVPLGEAELRVRASQCVNVQAVPAGADPFLRLAAARVYVKVDAETEALFRLHPGRYLLVGEAGAILREVVVPSEGAEVVLE